jgi:hypothetical protein
MLICESRYEGAHTAPIDPTVSSVKATATSYAVANHEDVSLCKVADHNGAMYGAHNRGVNSLVILFI